MTTIQRVRDRCGAPGHRKSTELAEIRFPPRPGWAEASNPIRALFDHQDLVLNEGKICWGYIVMANLVLYAPGPQLVSAANVVWSIDPFVDRFPFWLVRPADHLAHYHDEATRAPQPPIAHLEYLRTRDEHCHVSSIRLPLHMTDGRVVHVLTVLVYRDHLPKGYLTGRLVPLLVLHERHLPATGMILPSSLWPDELRRAWERA
jgi:hypothetical protein